MGWGGARIDIDPRHRGIATGGVFGLHERC